MIIAIFDTESNAYKGLDAFKQLDEKGDITLYASSVITKTILGDVEVKQMATEGPVGTAVGMLTGALVGLFGGPAGLAVGASAGTIGGYLYDVSKAGFGLDFLNEMTEVMLPGTTIVLAEVEEVWTTPVDSEIDNIGGIVLRYPRKQIVEDQLNQNAELVSKDMTALKEKIKTSSKDKKTLIQNKMNSLKNRMQSIADKAESEVKQLGESVREKISKLQGQMKKATEDKKIKIEKNIEELQADHKERKNKLSQASKLAKEALTQ